RATDRQPLLRQLPRSRHAPGSDQEAALAKRRCTAAGYQRVNQTAPRNATIDATTSIQSGIAGTYSAEASAATCTAKATGHTMVMSRLVVKKTGRAQMGSGTRSRAYCRV